jgi:predicted RNA binding protein YcfA (HicA-like mRNA interferase family)
MKAVSGRHLAQALEGKGWTLLRVHGSHHIYGKEGSVALPVPVHGDRPLKAGLQHHLMKLARLSEGDL